MKLLAHVSNLVSTYNSQQEKLIPILFIMHFLPLYIPTEGKSSEISDFWHGAKQLTFCVGTDFIYLPFCGGAPHCHVPSRICLLITVQPTSIKE